MSLIRSEEISHPVSATQGCTYRRSAASASRNKDAARAGELSRYGMAAWSQLPADSPMMSPPPRVP